MMAKQSRTHIDVEEEFKKRRVAAIQRAVVEPRGNVTPYTGIERRGSPRREYIEPIDITLPTEKMDVCVAKDLSPTGIGIVYVSPISGRIVVHLTNPLGNTYQLSAEVKRCQTIGRFYEIGAQFIERVDSKKSSPT